MVFLFSGCEVVKDLQEQAELAAKAPGGTGYDFIYTDLENPNKAIDSSSPGDVKNSQYLDKFDSNIITYSLTFTDEQATVLDDNGNNVTVTMNGTVNIGWDFWYNDPDPDFKYKMIVYSTGVNIKVGDDDMGSVPVDILFSFTTSLSSGSVTASIEGNVGDYEINISISVPFDPAQFLTE